MFSLLPLISPAYGKILRKHKRTEPFRTYSNPRENRKNIEPQHADGEVFLLESTRGRKRATGIREPKLLRLRVPIRRQEIWFAMYHEMPERTHPLQNRISGRRRTNNHSGSSQTFLEGPRIPLTPQRLLPGRKDYPLRLEKSPPVLLKSWKCPKIAKPADYNSRRASLFQGKETGSYNWKWNSVFRSKYSLRRIYRMVRRKMKFKGKG